MAMDEKYIAALEEHIDDMEAIRKASTTSMTMNLQGKYKGILSTDALMAKKQDEKVLEE